MNILTLVSTLLAALNLAGFLALGFFLWRGKRTASDPSDLKAEGGFATTDSDSVETLIKRTGADLRGRINRSLNTSNEVADAIKELQRRTESLEETTLAIANRVRSGKLGADRGSSLLNGPATQLLNDLETLDYDGEFSAELVAKYGNWLQGAEDVLNDVAKNGKRQKLIEITRHTLESGQKVFARLEKFLDAEDGDENEFDEGELMHRLSQIETSTNNISSVDLNLLSEDAIVSLLQREVEQLRKMFELEKMLAKEPV